MKLQQLRFLCEIVDRELSISNAAAALHTSQPSVSRQIQALEKELGVAVFARSRKRILGLTKPGIEVLQIARRMVRRRLPSGRARATPTCRFPRNRSALFRTSYCCPATTTRKSCSRR